ncbi:unnamed protein product [Ostreobium quekettii]|uniref:Uncharacterized protein n=1 Tax=Ostreobium quekettii TaxID=121088 RepID=A0A8S1IVF3_9CHLO|nr:unnamed protein product [Ostreobium quekettii]
MLPDADDGSYAPEWEGDGAGGFGQDVGALFLQPEEWVEEDVAVGANTFRVRCLAGDNRHIKSQTGLMRWEGSAALARFIASSKSLLLNKSVLELGCGTSPLPSLAALAAQPTKVYVTDGSPNVVNMAERNIIGNCGIVDTSRAQFRVIEWGNNEQIEDIVQEVPSGFDVVLGADVLYSKLAVPLFFSTCTKLLVKSNTARLLVCYIIRSVSEAEVLKCARSAGFEWESLKHQLPTAEGDCPSLQLMMFHRA